MHTGHINTLMCIITGDHPPQQTKTQAVSFSPQYVPPPSSSSLPPSLPPAVTSGTFSVPNTLPPSQPCRCHLAADTPLHFSIHLSPLMGHRGGTGQGAVWHVCVCLCACVWLQRGKGAGQVNELVIRIDVASAVGFPQTISTPTLSPSLSGHLRLVF